MKPYEGSPGLKKLAKVAKWFTLQFNQRTGDNPYFSLWCKRFDDGTAFQFMDAECLKAWEELS